MNYLPNHLWPNRGTVTISCSSRYFAYCVNSKEIQHNRWRAIHSDCEKQFGIADGSSSWPVFCYYLLQSYDAAQFDQHKEYFKKKELKHQFGYSTLNYYLRRDKYIRLSHILDYAVPLML